MQRLPHHPPRPSRHAVAAACLALLASGAVHAQADDGEQVVVTGTRVNTTVLRSLSPVQVVGGEALRATGAVDLRTALAAVNPSYININSNGGALAKNVRGSSLRGLAGNHVLVLVNGRRRHGTSLINNSGGASLGSSAADLGHIPVNLVERVEVLTDGASALYGSDAIAGVVNVILKASPLGGAANLSYGEYNHDVAKVNGRGDAGRTINAGIELGFEPFEDSVLTLGLSAHRTGDSHVTGPWKQPTRAIWQLYAAPGDPREATADRAVHANIEAVPLQDALSVGANFSAALGGGLRLSSFATFSSRESKAKGSYRSETNGTAHVETTPGGYGPALRTIEDDWQLNVSLAGGEATGWEWDVGASHGRNYARFAILNTTNASFGALVPLGDLYAGNLAFDESILQGQLRRAFAHGAAAEPLRVTAGAEWRHNSLALGQGEFYSYAGGGYVFPADYPAVNLRGTLAGAGSAFLTGFSPQFEFDRSRNNKALFIDFSQRFTPTLEAGVAARYERYSDFGSALSGKLSGRWQASESVALRSTVSNGFRAPSLQEQFYTSATVQPTNDPITNTSYISYNYDTLPQDAPAALALGATPLRAEKSRNVSVGVVFTPSRSTSVTLDLYQIDITDRIYLTSAFNGFNNATVAGILRAAGLTTQQQVRYFTNVGDTQTRGLEFKAETTTRHGNWGQAAWSLSWGRNEQKVKQLNTPAVLANAGLSLLGRDRLVLLEETLPQNIVRAGVQWKRGNWQIDLVERWYDKTRSVNNVLNEAQDSISPQAFITDASLAWNVAASTKVTIGANNLFNRRAPNQPEALASTINYENPWPNQTTPWGIGGAFYYLRFNHAW